MLELRSICEDARGLAMTLIIMQEMNEGVMAYSSYGVPPDRHSGSPSRRTYEVVSLSSAYC